LVAARFGFLHRFNEDTNTKVKLNNAGDFNILLKHKLSDAVTGVATTGFNLRSVVGNSKTKSLPLGLKFVVNI
jgi:hypothetical protein